MATPTNGPSLETRTSHFTLALTLTLFTWPALTLAVQENWGGPSSSSKREWACGAVLDLFASPSTYLPETEDVEERLLQIMEDEFEVVVDDGSAADVADRIMRWWDEVYVSGEFGNLRRFQEEYEARRGNERVVMAQGQAGSEDGDSVDDESGEEDEEDDDVEMGDAVPTLVPRERQAPEVDDEGFTKVVGRRRPR